MISLFKCDGGEKNSLSEPSHIQTILPPINYPDIQSRTTQKDVILKDWILSSVWKEVLGHIKVKNHMSLNANITWCKKG